MKRLPSDVSRCVGRSDMTAVASICAERETCMRHTSLLEDANSKSRSQRYTVAMDLRNADGVCRRRIEMQP